ncbi:Ig-like domain-containing protein [Vibrio sp. RC27]
MSLQLKVILNGQVSYLPLSNSNLVRASHLGVAYTLIDENGDAVTSNLELKRQENTLEISYQDEVVAVIDGFYVQIENAPVYWIEGGPLPEIITDADGRITEQLDNFSLETVVENGTFISGSKTLLTEQGIVWISNEAPQQGILTPITESLGLVQVGTLLIGSALYEDNTSNQRSDSNQVEESSYNIDVEAVAGRFQSTVQIDVYDQDGNLLTSKTLDMSSNSANFSLNSDYSGPILVVVSDINGIAGDYIDETTGDLVSLDSSLSAMGIVDGFSDISLSVTPLTELAVRQAGVDINNISLTMDDLAVNDQIGDLFGVDDIIGSVITVLDDEFNLADGLSNEEEYGSVLAILSGADSGTGSIDATLDTMESAISETSGSELSITQTGVELLASGVDNFESGTNADKTELSYANLEVPMIDEASDGLDIADSSDGVIVKVPDAAVGDSITIHWGSTNTYTVTISNSEINLDGTASITVPSSVVNAAGDGEIEVSYKTNGEKQSPSVLIDVEVTAPTISISSDATDLKAGETATITFTLSESSTDFSLADISYSGGVLSNFSGSGTSYTATFTPTTDTTATANISVGSSAFSDAAGNQNTDGSDGDNRVSISVDTESPTLASSVPGDESTDIDVDANILLTFDDDVIEGVGNITISNGDDDIRTIAITDTTQVTISGNTVTIDPTDDLNSSQDYTVTVDQGALLDGSGNDSTAVSDSKVNFTTEYIKPDEITVIWDFTDGSITTTDEASAGAFLADVEYTFMFIVDSDSANLVTTDMTRWSGGSNLGSDETYVLYGNGEGVLGMNGGYVTGDEEINTYHVAWMTSNKPTTPYTNNLTRAGYVGKGGWFQRRYSNNTQGIGIWSDTWGGFPTGSNALLYATSTNITPM